MGNAHSLAGESRSPTVPALSARETCGPSQAWTRTSRRSRMVPVCAQQHVATSPYSNIFHLPTDLRFRLPEIRIEQQRLTLGDEVRSNADADLIAGALRSRVPLGWLKLKRYVPGQTRRHLPLIRRVPWPKRSSNRSPRPKLLLTMEAHVEQLLNHSLVADVTYGPAHNSLGTLIFMQKKLYLAAEAIETSPSNTFCDFPW